MPTYEYLREDGSTFEIIQKISEESLAKCPTTGQKVKRLISGGSGVIYKGEGWYITDYKNKGNGSAAKNGENGTTETAKSEKPAEKTPSATESAS